MNVGYLLIRGGKSRVACVYIHALIMYRLTIDICKELRETCRRVEFVADWQLPRRAFTLCSELAVAAAVCAYLKVAWSEDVTCGD